MLNIVQFLPIGKFLFEEMQKCLYTITISPVGKIKKSEIRTILLSAFDLCCKALSNYIIDDE